MNATQLLRAELRPNRSQRNRQRAKSLIPDNHLVVDFVEESFPTVNLTHNDREVGSGLTVHWLRLHGCAIGLAAVVHDCEGSGLVAVVESNEAPLAVDFERFPTTRTVRSPMTARAHPLELAVAVAETLGVSHVTIRAESLPPLVDEQFGRWLDVASDAALSNEPRLCWSIDGQSPHSNRSSSSLAVAEVPAARLFLSVNPNATGALGHFVGFDANLRDLLDDRTDFASLGHQSLDPGDVPHWMIPTFSTPTSPGDSRYRSPTAQRFIDAEFPIVRSILNDVSRFYDDVHIFWYLGCAEYIPLVEHAAELFPSMTWHLHLFWDFRLDDDNPAAMTRFASLIARAQRLSNVHLSIGSESHRDLLLDHFAIDIAYFPAGPSVNLTDAESYCELEAARPANPANAFFPSNHSVGKNWALSARAALLLQDQAEPAFESLYIRVIDDQMPVEHHALAVQLRDSPNITVLEGPLSAEELTGRIRECGVIGLPYTPEWFRYRTSALLTESIVQGCRVVCLDDTNLAEVVRRTASGTVVSADVTAADFAVALGHERQAVHELASDRRKAWFQTTSWQAVTSAALLPVSPNANDELDESEAGGRSLNQA